MSTEKDTQQQRLRKQIKIKMRHQRKSIRIAKIEIAMHQMLVKTWRSWITYTLPVRMQNGAATRENSLAIKKKIKHASVIQPSNSTVGDLSQRY